MTTKLAHNQLKENPTKNFDTAALAVADVDLIIGDVVRIKDRADGVFDAVDATTVTENEYNILTCTGNTAVALEGRVRDADGRILSAVFGVGDGIVDDALAIQAAQTFSDPGDTIVLPAGTVTLGTTQIATSTQVNHFVGAGTGSYNVPANAGTVVSYTGADAGFMISESSSMYDMTVTGGGVAPYAIRVGDNAGGFSTSWGGLLSNVMATGATTAGIVEYGNQLGLMHKVYCQNNTGCGKLTDGSANTHGTYVACRFYNNSEEGVLYGTATTNASHMYYGCHSEQNGYEGVKNELDALNEFVWDGGWVETNNTDGTHASGYYNFFFNNASNTKCKVTNTRFNGASTANNTHIGFQGELELGNNRYTGTSKASRVEFLGVNDVLVCVNEPTVQLRNGTLVTASVNNRYVNATGGEVISYTTSQNLPRLNGVIINNTGAVGSITLTLPIPTGQEDFVVSTTAAQAIVITPYGGGNDHIIPTAAAINTSITNNSTLGDSVTLKSQDGTYWQETSIVGTWT